MPIMPSGSYHKYDVDNYKDIDKSYGTLDDFKNFLSEAHKRGINVIIDLVINHTSNTNEWFKKAKEELKEGKTDGYAQYYNFVQSDSKPADVGASKYYFARNKGLVLLNQHLLRICLTLTSKTKRFVRKSKAYAIFG